jgi:tRNA threonylcarbamoyladenosine biosynthesis protein TsaB
MIILHIETSTTICSVALSKDGECIFSRSNNEGMNHATLLSPFIADALDVLKKLSDKPDAIAVSSGPGSYTGLRIGVSTAKGLCYGFDIPLIAVSTTEILALSAINSVSNAEKALFCPMIDARRMEVYDAIYDGSLNIIRKISASIIESSSYNEFLSEHTVYFFGNGSGKCKSVLSHPNTFFLENIEPVATNMIPLAETLFLKQKFEDVAYFEPFYLKEFQATIPKKLL